jgi:hypothetical protein
MLVSASKSASRVTTFLLAFAVSFLAAKVARAQESIIRHPGDHPNYSVEIEPHLDLALVAPTAGSSGFGVGGRFTIPVVKNGFVPTINNSVGVGFGLDWLHYNGCYYYYPYYTAACDNLNSFWIPVVMQWNFFLASHWSVFGEPGLAVAYQNYGNYYGCFDGAGRPIACGPGPNRTTLEPVIFFGGRYHFSEGTALILRVGWPYASFGISFFP